MSDKKKEKVETPRSENFSIKNVRISYPNLFQPKAYQDKGEKKYSATFMLPKTDTKQVEKVQAFINEIVPKVMKLKAKELKKNGDTTIRPKYIMFQDGDLEENEIYHGHYLIKASRHEKLDRPMLVDPLKNKLDDTPENRRLFQGGNYVDVSVNLWHPVAATDPYITFSLNAVRYRKEGEPFGGGINLDTAFNDIDDEDDDNDDLESLDDDTPF